MTPTVSHTFVQRLASRAPRFLLCLIPLVFTLQRAVFAQSDVGTTVNGYQDDFFGATLASDWLVQGANVYTVNNGVLRVTSAAGDPNHLVYGVAGYNTSVQEVLARIRILNFGTGDAPRAGIATCVTAGTGGINLHFRDENLGRHVEFLDDQRAWGTEQQFAWQNNIWYWVRLRHEPNAPSQGGVNDVFGKIWPADGSQAEPGAWQNLYDYIPARSARTGYAGIVASSQGGTAEFEIDYILIKASGLPSITVAPAAVVQTPVTITNQPQHITTIECRSATFTVGYTGTPPISFQWHRDGAPIPHATNATYTLANIALSDNGSAFHVLVSNVASNTPYSVTSSNAILTVSGDVSQPALLSAANNGLNQIVVTFSEPVTALTANDPFNYTITNNAGSLPVLSATLAPNQTNVTVVTTNQVEGVLYTLTVNGITDACSGNLIEANSQVTFIAVAYTPADIGTPLPSGNTVAVSGGYNVTGGGRDIGGTSDQFQFSYQQRSGDFDLKVRIKSLGLSDAWAEAGLMARESLDAGSPFASTIATPSISGSYFQSRTAASGATTSSGSFPVNFPHTWLRLQRVGNQFSGYASFDGESWTLLGTASLALPANLYFGFAVSSHNTNQTTTAAFRDLAPVTSVAADVRRRTEPLGQSSRRTSLVISEIMFNPLDRPDGKNLEFVELFNSLSTPEDISGYRLDGDADFTFPPGTVMPAGGFLVVAQFPADVESVYGITSVLGPFSNTNSLPNDRGTVRLRNRIGAVFLEANYDTEAPWPVAADGAGHSLVLARPSFGERNVETWAASDSAGGSPGRLDPVTSDPLRNIVINEFLANTDLPELDYIELYNSSGQPVDISGCYLTDDRNTNKFTIPATTILAPRGFIQFNQNQLGFALSSTGERLYFRNPSNTRVLDAVRFEAQGTGISSGRYPDGSPGFSGLASKTPGAANGPLLLRPVVINEIMYHPISEQNDDEYIELHNRSGASINLSGWRITGGISFTFPPNSSIPANGYVVVGENTERLLSRYPQLNANNTFGNYGGGLANGGERIALSMLDTNANYVVIDEVTYRDGGRWGKWSDGGGSSLELIDPRSDNRLAANWADSDESAKAPWTTISVPGVMDNGAGNLTTSDQLQVFLQGAGECLIDDVEVRGTAGTNVIANSTFESGAGGWTAEGTQAQSGLNSDEGFNSARSYRIVATDRGDNQVNRIRTPLGTVQAQGATVRIGAKARWLRGHPEVLFRLRGNFHEAVGVMNLPPNLGTPGLPNSRLVANAGPAISDVTHSPAVPAANEPVTVTARVHDPDSVASVQVKYRIDPNATLASLAMVRGGDGLYSATIPGQAANVLVAFHIEATDQFVPPATTKFPNDAPVRECLVRFGETTFSGSFPSYRIWMTQASFNAWDTRHNLNNTMNDITFVLGNHRVIYNAGATYAGSPYIAPGFNNPTGNRCGYAIDIPPDDRFLGDAALQVDWPGGHGNENTAIQEEMAYYIADQINIAYSHRYHIRWTVNGVTDMQRGGVFEAVLQPGGDFIEQWQPENPEGDFFKIDRAFEFNDGGGLIADPEPQLRVYSTPDLVNGGTKKKTEKYRWYWLMRSFDRANDYTNIFVHADALNATSPEPYTSQTEMLADVEQWMGIFAVEHIINNFDSWGHDIGKNMYMFIPQNGRSQLYMFDLDWLMLVSPNGPGGYTASTGPLFSSDDPTVTRMYNHPPFRRAYFRAVQDAVDFAFVTPKYEAVMDAKYNALVANGITLCDGQALQPPTAVKTWFSQRRTFLVGQLNAVNSPFNIAGTNYLTVSSNLVTLAGTAPITVKTIEINGVPWPVTWTSVNGWTLRLPVSDATNDLVVLGYDRHGNLVTGASNRVTVVYTGGIAPPEAVVINEIMYHPTIPAAEFVELFNTSSNSAFDLSGWRFNGLDYSFPTGSMIAPRSFLVLARDAAATFAAHSTNVIVFDRFNGNLQANGETISLLIPGGANAPDTVVDKVRYENILPWPRNADGSGASLQVIDAAQDNSRVGNWSGDPGWVFVSRTGSIVNATNVLLSLAAAGNAYIDDVALVGPGSTNIIINGGFESDLGPEWLLGTNYIGSAVVSGISHSGTRSLFLNALGPGGNTLANSVQHRILGRIVTNATYTISFWCLANTNAITVNIRTLPGANLQIGGVSARVQATPGASNIFAATLPPFPSLWLNEIQPENLSGILDNNGQRDPWLELYNAGTDTIALEGLYLSDNYTNLTKWLFPAGASIAPGEFKTIFADNHPAQSTLSELHTAFRLNPGFGSLALSRIHEDAPQVIDYITYTNIVAGRSYGSYPDGQSFDRLQFFNVTPGATNNAGAAPVIVRINEWMAANTITLADPADGQFEDWFELYNPSPEPADLSGYYLSDENRLQSLIPPGYVIPPHGYLLVWADNERNQNSTNRIDLHVSFALSRDGEQLSLFAPDGTPIDAITFGRQTNDISEGRYADGTPSIYYMTTPTPRAENTLGQSDPPEFTTFERTGDQLTIGWGTIPGRTYRVEYTDDLAAPNWQALGPDMPATGATLSITISVTTPAQRFFRIVAL